MSEVETTAELLAIMTRAAYEIGRRHGAGEPVAPVVELISASMGEEINSGDVETDSALRRPEPRRPRRLQ